MPPKSIKTFTGLSLNSSSYETKYINPGELPEANIVFIDEAQADSVNSGTFTVGQREVLLSVRIKQSTPRNSTQESALREQLLRWFERGKRGDLVGGFDDGRDYQIDCSVARADKSADDDMVYIVRLMSGDTYWRSTTPDIDSSWAPSTTPATHVITVQGTAATRINLTLTPTNQPTGTYLYQNIVQLVNVPGVALGLIWLCITLDTASLVAAGQLQESCDDLRLFDGSTQIRRWIISPNTASTKVWFLINLVAGQALTLFSGVAQVETATAVGTITGSGNAQVVVTATGMTGSPKTFNVPVLNGDIPAVWAAKVRTALNADAAVTALYKVSGAGPRIVLVRKAPANNDSALNIALANGTCTGITGAGSSANTTAGSLYSVASTGSVTELAFAVNDATKASMKALKAYNKFILVHGTEWFQCRTNSTSEQSCELTVLQRGILDTTQQQHDGGDIFYFIEHQLVLYAGNDAAADPTTATNYDNTKPVIDLSQSDNTKAVWSTSSLFYDPTLPNRPGSWVRFLSKSPGSTNSKVYSITGDASSGNPALGVKAAAYKPSTAWLEDVITGKWQLHDGRRIRRITCTGRKFRSSTAFPGVAKLQCSPDGSTWTDVFSESSPGSAGAWANWPAHTNIDIDDTSAFLQFIFSGGSGKVANSYEMFEALSFTAYWKTAYIPSLTLLGWKSNYYLDIRMTNTATIDGVTYADYIELLFPMMMDKPMVLDNEAGTVEYDGINAHSAMTLDDESRAVWLRAWPGVTNTLRIRSVSGQSIGTLGVTSSIYRRRS